MNAMLRVPLNPCDCCIYGQDRVGYAAYGKGNHPFMMVDAVGHADSDAVLKALSRIMSAHPVTMATLRVSPFRLRPFWQVSAAARRDYEHAAQSAFYFEDLRSDVNWQRRLEAVCRERYNSRWDPSSPPQVRLEHYALPNERTRLVFRWPHYLMDATGAQWFLAKLDDDPQADNALLPDDARINVLRDATRGRRWSLALRGLRAQRAIVPAPQIRNIINPTPGVTPEFRLLHRHWESEAFATIRENARKLTPPGPALHARHLTAGVLRALHRIFTEHDVVTGAYCITFPMSVGASVPGSNLLHRRPLIGNYLVAPTICCTREKAEDRAAIAETVRSQLQAFLATEGDLRQWAMLELAARVHPWFYGLLFKLPPGVNIFASGFSYYGEIERPLRTIGGAKVVNIWGGGPTTTPPAWNPVFSRFGDRLNLSLTYVHPAVSDELAQRYLARIDEEICRPT